MAKLDLQPGLLDVVVFPGNIHVLTLAFPIGLLNGTSWEASIGGFPVDDVTVDGDNIKVSFTAPSEGRHLLRVAQTAPGSNVAISGLVISSRSAGKASASSTATVTVVDGPTAVNVTVVGGDVSAAAVVQANLDTLQDRVSETHANVKDAAYGAFGNGSTDDRAALVSADTAGNMFLPPGTYRVASNLTLSKHVQFAAGAKLKPDSGVTVTIGGTIDAPLSQVFDVSAGGTVSFGASAVVSEVYPQWWGAKGDGVTDDRASLQAAVSATAAAGGAVHIPSGTYALGSEVVILNALNRTLKGSRAGRTVLKMLGTATSRAVRVQNSSNVTIADLTIDMNRSATTDQGNNDQQQGIYVVKTSAGTMENITVRDVQVFDGHRRGMAITRTAGTLQNVTVERCLVDNMGERGIHASNASAVRIERCQVSNTGFSAIVFQGTRRCQIVGNVIDTTLVDHGIALVKTAAGPARETRILGNHIQNCAEWGIVASINTTEFVIADNICDANGGGIAIDVEDGENLGVLVDVNGTVCNNLIKNSMTTHGMNVRICRNLSILGNVVVDGAFRGIAVANAVNCMISGNLIRGNAGQGLALLGNTTSGNHVLGINDVQGNAGDDYFSHVLNTPPRVEIAPFSAALVGFYGATPVARPSITGSTDTAKLASVIAALVAVTAVMITIAALVVLRRQETHQRLGCRQVYRAHLLYPPSFGSSALPAGYSNRVTPSSSALSCSSSFHPAIIFSSSPMLTSPFAKVPMLRPWLRTVNRSPIACA
jgi:polygalacturonase